MSPDDHRPHTKTKPFSTAQKPSQLIHILRISHFRPPHIKSTSTPRTRIKSISVPVKPISIPHSNSKFISTLTLKSSLFQSHLFKQFNLDAPTQKKNDPDTKTKSLSTPHKDQVDSDPVAEINSIWIPHRHEVNFDHPLKNRVNFNAHTKPSHFRPAHKSKSISTSRRDQVNRSSD